MSSPFGLPGGKDAWIVYVRSSNLWLTKALGFAVGFKTHLKPHMPSDSPLPPTYSPAPPPLKTQPQSPLAAKGQKQGGEKRQRRLLYAMIPVWFVIALVIASHFSEGENSQTSSKQRPKEVNKPKAIKTTARQQTEAKGEQVQESQPEGSSTADAGALKIENLVKKRLGARVIDVIADKKPNGSYWVLVQTKEARLITVPATMQFLNKQTRDCYEMLFKSPFPIGEVSVWIHFPSSNGEGLTLAQSTTLDSRTARIIHWETQSDAEIARLWRTDSLDDSLR